MLTFYGGAASLDVGGLFDGGGKTAAESILHRLSAVSDADVSASSLLPHYRPSLSVLSSTM